MTKQFAIECRERMFQPWFIVGSDHCYEWAIAYAQRYQAQHPTSWFRVTNLRTKERTEIEREGLTL